MPERRIGVIGLQGSGKTVLLTSLINHLMHHDPRRFPLGDGNVEVTHFVQELPDPGWDQFPVRQGAKVAGTGGLAGEDARDLAIQMRLPVVGEAAPERADLLRSAGRTICRSVHVR